jgi:protein SCO1/2
MTRSALTLFVLAFAIGYGAQPVIAADPKTFEVKGTIREIKPDAKTVTIDHEAIPNYMEAMTMPFRVKGTNELAGLRRGDVVRFRLSVTESESWIDRISRVGTSTNTPGAPAVTSTNQPATPTANILEGLSAYTFINEFGRPVNFREYRGQAIALTFFFTRCPIPDYCPRLTKNFLAATRKLESLPNAPTNWHLFSISFDTQIDTPEVLRGYANAYAYNSNRWSFLTASAQTIAAVTRNFGFSFKKEAGTFTHEFLTVVLNAEGYWQAAWPIGGDTSDVLVEELIKAAAVKPKQTP